MITAYPSLLEMLSGLNNPRRCHAIPLVFSDRQPCAVARADFSGQRQSVFPGFAECLLGASHIWSPRSPARSLAVSPTLSLALMEGLSGKISVPANVAVLPK